MGVTFYNIFCVCNWAIAAKHFVGLLNNWIPLSKQTQQLISCKGVRADLIAKRVCIDEPPYVMFSLYVTDGTIKLPLLVIVSVSKLSG